ncbi:MAG: hypothetical protein A2Z07_03490 [Armatimonadetes bacterium RBG_16_67_12]|nr:MAG: hypothetical protein A2Z07_03490 [Armatimonadetes bacterium RBG_16_67_12]
MASLLSTLGCACGHESVFNPKNLTRDTYQTNPLARILRLNRHPGFITPQEMRVGETLVWPASLCGDSSWLAAPYLSSLPRGTAVLHQVRDPIPVIRSLVRIRFFDTPSPFRLFAEAHLPSVKTGTLLERSLRYWVEWNRLIQRAEHVPHLRYVRYRVEDVTPLLLQDFLSRAGIACDLSKVEAVLRAHPRTVNTRGSKRRDHLIRRETLPTGQARLAYERLAEEYGYPPGGPRGSPSAAV